MNLKHKNLLNFKTKVLFSLQLKIASELLDIEVLNTDTIHTLVQRVSHQNQISKSKQKIIQQKILESFINLLKSENISNKLKQKINKFIKKVHQQKPQNPSENNQNQYNQKSIKPLFSENPLFQSQKKKPQKQCQTKQFKNMSILQKTPVKSKEIEIFEKAQRSFQKIEPKINKENNYQQKQQINQLKNYLVDSQLLNAYKIVYSRSQIPQLKEITSKIIKQFQYKKDWKQYQTKKQLIDYKYKQVIENPKQQIRPKMQYRQILRKVNSNANLPQPQTQNKSYIKRQNKVSPYTTTRIRPQISRHNVSGQCNNLVQLKLEEEKKLLNNESIKAIRQRRQNLQNYDSFGHQRYKSSIMDRQVYSRSKQIYNTKQKMVYSNSKGRFSYLHEQN